MRLGWTPSCVYTGFAWSRYETHVFSLLSFSSASCWFSSTWVAKVRFEGGGFSVGWDGLVVVAILSLWPFIACYFALVLFISKLYLILLDLFTLFRWNALFFSPTPLSFLQFGSYIIVLVRILSFFLLFFSYKFQLLFNFCSSPPLLFPPIKRKINCSECFRFLI